MSVRERYDLAASVMFAITAAIGGRADIALACRHVHL